MSTKETPVATIAFSWIEIGEEMGTLARRQGRLKDLPDVKLRAEFTPSDQMVLVEFYEMKP